MLIWKLLIRDWKGGQLGLIATALVLAVAVVTSITLVADRVEKALNRETSSFLAADMVVRSSKDFSANYLTKAKAMGLQSARVIEFASMLFRGDDSNLASVKAVEATYPLRGKLTVSDVAFTANPDDWTKTTEVPPPGEVWIGERLIPLLDIQLGDMLEVGEAKLKATKIVVAEPDGATGFSAFGARVLMNYADIPESKVIQPGSRVRYKLLVAGDEKDVQAFGEWVKQQKSPHESLVSPQNAQENLQSTLEKGRQFLLLAGSVGVMLSAIALALASHRYATRHINQVALFKSWGLQAVQIRRIYFLQCALLAFLATLIGLCIGWLIHLGLLGSIKDLLPQGIPPADAKPMIAAFVTGIACLLGFALPAIWHLPGIPPLRVLRRDIQVSMSSQGSRLLIGIGVIFALVIWYSGSMSMAVYFLSGLFAVCLVTGVFGYFLLAIGKRVSHWAGSRWRLALANLWRRRTQTLLQMVAFGATTLLLLIMITVRTSLIDDWKLKMPPDAPNHFVVNVAPHEVQAVNNILQQQDFTTQAWYALVRARITEINDTVLSEAQQRRSESVRREVNLSTADTLPLDNQIVKGQWWDGLAGTPVEQGVSVEKEVATDLGLEIGDSLTFSVGGQQLITTVSSIRTLKWENMQPNFYFLFPTGVLDKYPNMSITSVFIPREKKIVVNDVLKQYPTIAVIDLDEIINTIRKIIDRVTLGLELMLLLVLACGGLVMFAAINSSFDERLQESAVLRTLGSSRKTILGVLGIEFVLLGLLSGLIAAVGAEAVIYLLQTYMFQIEHEFHPEIWLLGPVGGALIIGVLGLWRSKSIVTVPPLQSLRAVG
ncbi:MAG: ABC transporter permease [Gammaproteobacteria bacterium]|nr:ABC transporter permease [Gammaproteobacteria bacterium]NNC97473.1 ABC transporter permease [Gammaproteobacteria bacterium]NNM14887.1 ABC transporter permease [Gammaproteobacteria bacterium]